MPDRKTAGLSIITVTFNNFEELTATENSISQLKNFEKVVVNGGSCARTREFLEKRNDFISVTEKDEGIADAFNKGIRLSTQKYVTFLNSGDLCISDDYFIQAVAYLETHPDVDYVHAKILFKDRVHGDLIIGSESRSYKMGMFVNHPGLVMRKSLYDELGYFSKSYRLAMDYEWLLRTIKKNKRRYFIPTVAVEMDGNGMSSTNDELSYQECRRALKENGLYDLESKLLFFVRRFKLIAKRVLPMTIVHAYKRFRFGSAGLRHQI